MVILIQSLWSILSDACDYLIFFVQLIRIECLSIISVMWRLPLTLPLSHSTFSAMKPEFLNLFSELCEEQVMLYIDPEGVKAKKKQRKIDFEISDLRLKLANTSGKSIVLSNREIRLLRYKTSSALFKNTWISIWISLRKGCAWYTESEKRQCSQVSLFFAFESQFLVWEKVWKS